MPWAACPPHTGAASPAQLKSLVAVPLGEALECRVGLMEAPPPAHRPVGFVMWSRGSAPTSIQKLSWQPKAPDPLSLLSSGEERVTYFALCLVSSPAQVEKDVQLWQNRRTSPSLEFCALHLCSSAFLTKVKATDADEGINGRVWYRIVKGKSRYPFVHRGICPRLCPALGS